MLHHVAYFVAMGHIPTEVMVTGVDDEDIAFFHFHAVSDHLAGVHIIITSSVAQINDGGIVYQVIEFQGGDVFTSGPEVAFAIQVGTKVVGMSYDLAIGTIGGQAFEVFHLKRFVRRPSGGCDT